MEQAGAGLRKLVAELLRDAPPEQAPLLAWPLACGPAWAAQTRALRFCDGVLEVETPDPDVRGDLEKLLPRYLAALQRIVGARVRRIALVNPEPPNDGTIP